LQSLFQSPTIAEMATVITEHQARKIAEPELERILAELECISEEKARQFLGDAMATNTTRQLMSDSPIYPTQLPPEQQAMQPECFHSVETYTELERKTVDNSIPARFERIVQLYPDCLAVKDKDRSLTYDQLNRTANRIARAIIENRGPGSEP